MFPASGRGTAWSRRFGSWAASSWANVYRSLLKVPWRDEVESGGAEVEDVAGRRTAANHPGDRGDHAVRRRHGKPLPCRGAHEFAIGESGFLCEPEYPISEPTTPSRQPLIEPRRAPVGQDLVNAE